MGKHLKTEEEIITSCEELHKKGIPHVLVSRGKNGIFLSTKEQKLKAIPPPVDAQSTVGAGDSAVAGFVLAHAQGKDLTECLRIACATGTATAQTPGTELCHRADVKRILPLVHVYRL
jgi:fructose-1-phosphate kinase PfkB-like protein